MNLLCLSIINTTDFSSYVLLDKKQWTGKTWLVTAFVLISFPLFNPYLSLYI